MASSTSLGGRVDSYRILSLMVQLSVDDLATFSAAVCVVDRIVLMQN